MAGRDPAEARLWAMTLARLCGIGIAILGMWLAASSGGRMAGLAGGLLLMAAGAAVTLLGPRALYRRWRE